MKKLNKEQYKLFINELNYWKEQQHKYYMLTLDKTCDLYAEFVAKYETAKSNVKKLENGKYIIIDMKQYGYHLQIL